MSNREEILESKRPTRASLACLGLVVHPSRAIERPLRELREWADRHKVHVVQIRAEYEQQRVAEQGDADGCELILSIGGDGTTLAAIRAGVVADQPVLGVACGSLGVLTTVPPDAVAHALERFNRGEWTPRLLPGLDVQRAGGQRLFALNDIAVVRDGAGQLRLTAHVDRNLFARLAGDGCVVSTPLGSSAYALAAGGPLLTPETAAFVLTPLPAHGGSCPPIVIGPASQLVLDASPGHGGVRLEVDGQLVASEIDTLTVTFREDVATIVTFDDDEPFLSGLRRRQIIADSPRILAEDALRYS
jgi:NAD+ kinase